MPTYEYHCEKCRGNFDFFQSMKDDRLTVCPEKACLRKKWGKGKVERQLGTGAGLIFKGSGFYITDYRSEGYKEAAKKDSAPPPSADKSGDDAAKSSQSSSKTESKSTESKPKEKAPKAAKD